MILYATIICYIRTKVLPLRHKNSLSMTETDVTVMPEGEGGTSGAITCVRPELFEVQCFM